MSFADTLPDSLKIVSLKSGSNTCGGSITDLGGSALGSGDTGVKLTGGPAAIQWYAGVLLYGVRGQTSRL